tara:strand:+ start:2305 stop:2829 length:525 start_codon:yes stop_codon:yes gene_type:complete
MANKDNECKNLNVVTKFSDLSGKDAWVEMYNNQKKMQEETYGYDYSNMSIKEVVQYLFWNNHALNDEIHELMDALGGINDGIEITQPIPGGTALVMNGKGNAAWKPWKMANPIYSSVTLDELSEEDRKELEFEFIDIMHFVMNIGIAINMSPEKIYEMYMSKAEENKRRNKEGY